jgi:glycosyltransferase 2 family protein
MKQPADKRWRAWRMGMMLLLKLAATCAFTWYVLSKMELSRIPAALANLHAGWLIAAMVMIAAHVLASFLRWQGILAALGGALSFAKVARIYFAVMFVSNVLPTPLLGDAIRALEAKRMGLSLRLAAHSVLIERALAVIGLFAITGTLGWAFPIGDNMLWPAFSVLLLLAAAGGMVMTHLLLLRVPARILAWPVVRPALVLMQDGGRLLRSRQFLPVLFHTIMAHVTSGIAFYCILQGLDVSPPFWRTVTATMPVLLLSGLPISISGWGVREAAAVTAFGFLGVPPEQAFLASVIFGLMTLASTLPGALSLAQTLLAGRRGPTAAQP